MSINIFSGSSPGGKNATGKGKANTASNSTRAQQAKAALAAPAEASASGNTAVKTGGTLAKVGNVVGKVAGVASKFLPGVGGMVAKGLSNLLNDPEWWQSVPGEAITLNEPLRVAEYGQAAKAAFQGDLVGKLYQARSAILEIVSTYSTGPVNSDLFAPSEQMVTQYLMPEIRKVTNAITLQTASDYRKALTSGAAIYAVWRNLRKFDYMLKHGQTYLANMNDDAFPLFKTEYASWLQSTINRLEEYLRANVRLPHTLCEYLAWRFGRVYKSNNSAKAALVLYDVLPMTATTASWDSLIATLMAAVSTETTVQKANADIYNAYYEHDYMVEVRDDTQFRYDTKEFMLRLNMQQFGDAENAREKTPTLIAIDSSLDNPTAFMASTVSSIGQLPSGDYESLFPVDRIYVYTPADMSGIDITDGATLSIRYKSSTAFVSSPIFSRIRVQYASDDYRYSQGWMVAEIIMNQYPAVTDPQFVNILPLFIRAFLCKAVDLYNVGIYVPILLPGDNTTSNLDHYLDLTGLSIDAGAPTLATIATEHIYAFANLVNVDRKHSLSYKAAEKLVARDTANLIDTLDVATTATK